MSAVVATSVVVSVAAVRLPASSTKAAAPATTITAAPPTVPRSPLADGLATHDALLSSGTGATPAAPARLDIGALGVDASVVAIGLDDLGGAAVPADPTVAGWYRYGAGPGSDGSTVIVGHINGDGRPGVFARLADASPGETVDLTTADGRVHQYVVTQRQQFRKQAAPLDELFRTDGPERLVLITCGGELDRVRHSYEDNVVVTAVPSA